MDFTKLQGAGNDFVLIEGGPKFDYSRLARLICDRHFGVGSDGLLVLLPSKIADFAMRMFNPDGSEAEACGNGLRCLVKYVYEKGLVKGASKLTIETIKGVRRAELDKSGEKLAKIRVNMGVPRFTKEEIPLKLDREVEAPIFDYHFSVEGRVLSLNFVSMGNPHAVHFIDEPVNNFPLSQLGPLVERGEIFPQRVNFGVARVLSRTEIEARVWERGAGLTLACGSGACAIAVIAHLRNYVDQSVKVRLPGGVLEVDWDGVGEVFLSGPAEIVFAGKWLGEV